jgi:hypothetical protein
MVMEPVEGQWTMKLATQALKYGHGNLMLDDDILDSYDNERQRIGSIGRFRGTVVVWIGPHAPSDEEKLILTIPHQYI